MSRRPAARAAALVTAVVVALALVAGCGGDGAGIKVVGKDERPTYDYVIPRGAVQAAKDGTPVDVVPQDLKVKVGESIRIRNDDTLGANVGVFYVGAGETVSMQFTRPGTLEGVCSIHPSGRFTITVT